MLSQKVLQGLKAAVPKVVEDSQTSLLRPVASQLLAARPLGQGKLVASPGVGNKESVHKAHLGPTAIKMMGNQGGGPRIVAGIRRLWNSLSGSQQTDSPVSVVTSDLFESEKLREGVRKTRCEELQKMFDSLGPESGLTNVKVLSVIVEQAYAMASGTITRHALIQDDKGVYLLTLGTQRLADLRPSLDKITKEDAAWKAVLIKNMPDPSSTGTVDASASNIRSSILEEVTRPARMQDLLAMYELGLKVAAEMKKPFILHGHSLGGALSYGILSLAWSAGLKDPDAIVQYGGLPVIDKGFAQEITRRKISCVSFLHRYDWIQWIVSLWDIALAWYGRKDLGVPTSVPDSTKSKVLVNRQNAKQCFVGEFFVVSSSGQPSVLDADEHVISGYERDLLTPELREKNCTRMMIVDTTPEGEERIDPLVVLESPPAQPDGTIVKKKA